MSAEYFDPSWFGEQSEQVTLHEAQEAYIEEAKSVVLDRLRIATVDHNGKRLNERKWRYAMNLIEGL